MKLLSPRIAVLIEVAGQAEPVEHTVQTDNRDAVAWDMTRGKKGWPQMGDAPMLWATFVAWSALRRQKLIDLSIDDFLAACIAANVVDAEGNEAEDVAEAAGVDPTQTGPEPV